jgi:hypothetical protein
MALPKVYVESPLGVKKLVADWALESGRKMLGVVSVAKRIEADGTQRALRGRIRAY